MYVIIICATIPTLRQFYLQVVRYRIPGYTANNSYNKSGDIHDSIPLGSSAGRRIKPGSLAGGGGGAPLHHKRLHSQDNSSHEAILDQPDERTIYKKTDVSITYGNN